MTLFGVVQHQQTCQSVSSVYHKAAVTGFWSKGIYGTMENKSSGNSGESSKQVLLLWDVTYVTFSSSWWCVCVCVECEG